MIMNNKLESRFYRVLMMVYSTLSYWVFGLFPSSGALYGVETRCFGNWICFRPQVKGGENSFGSLRKS
jgi:hypothetical protein